MILDDRNWVSPGSFSEKGRFTGRHTSFFRAKVGPLHEPSSLSPFRTQRVVPTKHPRSLWRGIGLLVTEFVNSRPLTGTRIWRNFLVLTPPCENDTYARAHTRGNVKTPPRTSGVATVQIWITPWTWISTFDTFYFSTFQFGPLFWLTSHNKDLYIVCFVLCKGNINTCNPRKTLSGQVILTMRK